MFARRLQKSSVQIAVGHSELTSVLVHKLSGSTLLFIILWFALLTGLAEVGTLMVSKFLLHKRIHLGPHVIWMAPLANVFLFATAGSVIFLVAQRWSAFSSLRVVTFSFTFLSMLSLLFIFQRLHGIAAMLLSAGFALQAARFVGEHAKGFQVFVRRTVIWIMALILGLGVGLHGWERATERNFLEKLPPALVSAPNVLLIVLDTVRAENLSLYGYARPTTPRLKQLAKTGVVFERALSTAPWTLPTHASIFTGHYPYKLSVDWVTPLDDTYPTLAEMLSSQGYLTAGFVANTTVCSYEFGLNRGFLHYEDYPISLAEIVRSSSVVRVISRSYWIRRIIGKYQLLGRKTAAQLNEDFLRWLSRRGSRPFFAFLNYYDAHSPYLPPEPFKSKFAGDVPRVNSWLSENSKWPAAAIQPEIDAYDGAIAYIDSQLGRLFRELQKQNILKNTLIIITSDHGEEFGEHGLFRHGNSLYLPSLHVPLIIWPLEHGIAGYKFVPEPVSLRDLPATIFDLLDLEDKVRFPGNSLAQYWDISRTSNYAGQSLLLSEVSSGINTPMWVPISKGDMKSLLENRFHYILNGDGSEELYDLENDPEEKHDLVADGKSNLILGRFRKSLETIVSSNR